LWAVAQEVHGGKFVAMNAHVRKEGRSKINNLRFHIRKLEKRRAIKVIALPAQEWIKSEIPTLTSFAL